MIKTLFGAQEEGTKKKLKLSNTQVTCWMRCPRQYEFRYWKGIKMKPSGAMVTGTAYHGAMKANFHQKIGSGIDMPVEDVLDAYDTSWREATEPKEKDGVIETIDWEGNEPEKLKDVGYKLVKLYHTQIAPDVIPIAAEEEAVKQINSNVIYHGYIDVETAEGIIDHKVKGKMITYAEADKDFQVFSYCYLRDKANFSFHVAIKKKFPEVQTVSVKKTPEDISWWVKAVEQVAEQIETGNAPPNPHGWHCSDRFCGYYRLCKEMSR